MYYVMRIQKYILRKKKEKFSAGIRKEDRDGDSKREGDRERESERERERARGRKRGG